MLIESISSFFFRIDSASKLFLVDCKRYGINYKSFCRLVQIFAKIKLLMADNFSTLTFEDFSGK